MVCFEFCKVKCTELHLLVCSEFCKVTCTELHPLVYPLISPRISLHRRDFASPVSSSVPCSSYRAYRPSMSKAQTRARQKRSRNAMGTSSEIAMGISGGSCACCCGACGLAGGRRTDNQKRESWHNAGCRDSEERGSTIEDGPIALHHVASLSFGGASLHVSLLTLTDE